MLQLIVFNGTGARWCLSNNSRTILISLEQLFSQLKSLPEDKAGDMQHWIGESKKMN